MANGTFVYMGRSDEFGFKFICYDKKKIEILFVCRFDVIRFGTSRWRILTFLIIVFNRYGNKKDPKIIPKIKTAILIDDVLTTFRPRMNGGSGKYILI